MGNDQSKQIDATSKPAPKSSDALQPVTKQTCEEAPFMIRGKDNGRSAWHYIMVPFQNATILRARDGQSIDVTDLGSIIKYTNKWGIVTSCSGWGEEPPEEIKNFIEKEYDCYAIDENSTLTYLADDIRVCRMKRDTRDQLLGIYRLYHRHERFHYIRLSDDLQSSLAYKAGIKNYDRLIEYNDENIEKETHEQVQQRLDNRDQYVQLLVCSPATYAHYKKYGKRIHLHLATVKRWTPPSIIKVKTDKDDEQTIVVTMSEDVRESTASVCSSDAVCATKRKPTDIEGAAEKGKDDKKDVEEKRERRKRIIRDLLFSLIASSSLKSNDKSSDIHSATCDGCNSHPIHGDRYKCLQCVDYDLCGECFERGRETKQHVSGHAFAHFKMPGELFNETIKEVNNEVTLTALKQSFANEKHGEHMKCNGCTKTINGLRFKCDACHNYNLCLSCMEGKVSTQTHVATHSLIAIGKEALQEIAMDDIQLGDKLGEGGFGMQKLDFECS